MPETIAAEQNLTPTAEYARVALDLPIEQAYQYVVPPALREQAKLGSIVQVPVKQRTCQGCVIAFEERPVAPVVRPIEAILSPPFALTAELIELGRWMAEYYMAPLGETLRTISFLGFSDVNERKERLICLREPDYWLLHPGDVGPDGKRVTPQQRAVIEALLARGNEPTAPAILRIDAEVTEAVLAGMVKREILERLEVAAGEDDDYGMAPLERDAQPALTPAQSDAFKAILAPLHAREFRSFLLHGVTGSGKTEIYLRVIEEALRLGRQAVVLAPEIALTPQTVDRFRARFGDIVGVYHSRQTLRQKFDLWRKIHNGDVKIVVGARSALFSPFAALGVIVVDEEHSSSYKQDSSPRYHARDVALMRARRLDAIAILGSATPSLESYANALADKHTLLHLPLLCHLCGKRRKRVLVCPLCESKEMGLIGVGTQKVEETLLALYPRARTLRLDSDTARGRKAWNEAWEDIQSGGVDLILGTQMIAKGLHLERVTLVGVISADSSLFQPDFRSAERTFSLLAQAAGRSGRGDKPGEVVIQSYAPGHYAIQLACEHNYLGFFEREMRFRRALRFPPVQRLISVLIASEEAEAAKNLAGRLGGVLRALTRTERHAEVAVLGPAPCPIERIRNRWRHRILLRGTRPALMREVLREGLREFERMPGRNTVAVQLDVDPQDLL
ncbi:MAG: primosomal protein N' [Candidatus Sumerlaeota bacterium]|nr:primosomal protein N' [Candidatus Sumerlaeota bacterium]